MVYREKIPRVQSLNTAVVEFLRTNIPDLDGRVHSGITPEGESFPSAVVDVASQHDAHLGLDVGLERAGITVRCQTDPVGALTAWAADTLIVPPGHPRAGEPMALPDFAVDWLRESWDAHESALSTARKNAKSAIAAILCLGYLVGPLRRPGWRGAIASLDKNKAANCGDRWRRLPRRPGST